ncbi:hypothetical protein BDP67DRAFT_494948 [Colletotrichum lupini]|nr:hypothetical protein BDP67DRAFT_494948 [Colletotrichum lupini]
MAGLARDNLGSAWGLMLLALPFLLPTNSLAHPSRPEKCERIWKTSSVEQAFVLTPAEAPQARSEDSSRACVSTNQATTTPLNPCSRSTVLSRANPHSPHSAENTKRMALRSEHKGQVRGLSYSQQSMLDREQGRVMDSPACNQEIYLDFKRATAARITTAKDEMALLAASKDKMSVSLSSLRPWSSTDVTATCEGVRAKTPAHVEEAQ